MSRPSKVSSISWQDNSPDFWLPYPSYCPLAGRLMAHNKNVYTRDFCLFDPLVFRKWPNLGFPPESNSCCSQSIFTSHHLMTSDFVCTIYGLHQWEVCIYRRMNLQTGGTWSWKYLLWGYSQGKYIDGMRCPGVSEWAPLGFLWLFAITYHCLQSPMIDIVLTLKVSMLDSNVHLKQCEAHHVWYEAI